MKIGYFTVNSIPNTENIMLCFNEILIQKYSSFKCYCRSKNRKFEVQLSDPYTVVYADERPVSN